VYQVAPPDFSTHHTAIKVILFFSGLLSELVDCFEEKLLWKFLERTAADSDSGNVYENDFKLVVDPPSE
jgi:hypothetical protein